MVYEKLFSTVKTEREKMSKKTCKIDKKEAELIMENFKQNSRLVSCMRDVSDEYRAKLRNRTILYSIFIVFLVSVIFCLTFVGG